MNVQYLCYFDEWVGFMDGEIKIGTLRFDYDFVAVGWEDGGEHENLLEPFTADAAREHFASRGIADIEIVYVDTLSFDE